MFRSRQPRRPHNVERDRPEHQHPTVATTSLNCDLQGHLGRSKSPERPHRNGGLEVATSAICHITHGDHAH